jgi:hypothetical protein
MGLHVNISVIVIQDIEEIIRPSTYTLRLSLQKRISTAYHRNSGHTIEFCSTGISTDWLREQL